MKRFSQKQMLSELLQIQKRHGSTWTEGEDYTYDKTTGTFATGAGKVTVPAATFTVNETTGEWSSNPGFSTLTITGTV